MYNNHDVVLSVYLETDQPVYLVTGVVKQTEPSVNKEITKRLSWGYHHLHCQH